MANKKTYQALSQQLDDILIALQQPELNIDEAVKLYEQGRATLKELEFYLNKAENKIVKIKNISESEQ